MRRAVQSGFTLIELVIVIVILGILAAIAVPIYIDLRQEAAQAAVNGVAGSLSSAMAVNYAGRIAGAAGTVDVDNCDDGVSVLRGGLPTAGGTYAITAAIIAAPVGTTATCTLTFTPTGGTAVTSTFTGIRTAP